jgi:hypothetical protein
MSQKLALVRQVMFLCEGEVGSGDEAKVVLGLERILLDWKGDVVARVGKELTTPSKEDMASNMVQVDSNLEGYWCVMVIKRHGRR